MESGLRNDLLEQFVREGYCVLPGVVPQDQISAALRIINRELGFGLSEAEMKLAEKGSYCPKAAMSQEIAAIFNASKVQSAVADLVDKSFANTVFGGQIALRFPGALCDPHFNPVPFHNKIWHIDGLHTSSNGISERSIRNFTLLVGVMLSDVSTEFAGNLCVYPRSHHVLEKYFQQNGFDEAIEKGLEGLPGLPVGAAKQIIAKPGDVVLCHYQLAHSIAPNITSNIRYALYFRRQGDKHHPEPMLDIWLDFSEKVKAIANRLKPSVAAALSNHPQTTNLKPHYADELFRKEFAGQISSSKETLALREELRRSFDQQKWASVTEAFERLYLLDQGTTDVETILKSAAAFVFQDVHQAKMDEKKLKHLQRAEELARKALSGVPTISEGHSILVHSLHFQERHPEVVEAFTNMINCASERKDEGNAPIDAANIVLKSLLKMKREAEFEALLARACSAFPSKAAELKQLSSSIQTEQLQQQCWQWVFSPVKDFHVGRNLFSKLVSVKPNDFWANLIYGGCMSLTGSVKDGEAYIRKAKTIEDSVPHAYTMLAQNLQAQHRYAEAFAVVTELLQHAPFPTVATDPDHSNKIMEALSVAKQTDPTRFDALVLLALKSYPNLTQRIQELQVRQDSGGCLIQ